MLARIYHIVRRKFKTVGNPRGVALFMVLTSLAIMSAVVVDLGQNESIRYKLAIYERDAARAEALAAGGLNAARLFLVMQDKLQVYVANLAATGMKLPAYTIWNLMPLEGGMLTGLATGDLANTLGIDVSTALEERKLHKVEAGKFVPPPGGFGGFDGSLDIDITDEESKISIEGFARTHDKNMRNAIRKKLMALFLPEKYDPLFEGRFSQGESVSREELIANIFGYTDFSDHIIDANADDNNWGKVGAGSKKSLYAKYNNFIPKGAPFDTIDELRLVHGMTDAHMDAFADAITIFGGDGKVNILSASDKVLRAIMGFCAADKSDYRLRTGNFMDETMKGWHERVAAGSAAFSPAGFMEYITSKGIAIDKAQCTGALGTSSKNFTIKSTSTVGDVTRTLTLVARIVGITEELYYFNNG